MGGLEGRKVLVTGASSGIGEATARAIVASGGQVALLARSEGALREQADELGAVAVPADVTDVAAVRSAVERAADELEGLDGLVNAAGLARPGTVVDGDPQAWRTMFEVNVLGLLHVTQAAAPLLRARGHADIVNVSSMSGRRVGSTELAIYAATKTAVHTISEGMRRELQADGVRVTTIAPGLVDTPIFAGQVGPKAEQLGRATVEKGLPVGTVADSIVGVLAAPPHLVHVEVALLSIDQI